MKILLFFDFNIVKLLNSNSYFYNLAITNIVHKVILVILLYIILQLNNDQLFKTQTYHLYPLITTLANKT